MDTPSASDAGVAAPELMVSAQSLQLPAGIYAFTVRQSGPAPAHNVFAVPAVQVGLPPAAMPGAPVAFLTGPGTCENWLVRNGDVVVVRIDGNGTTLLLTSLRPADCDPLTVDVRRLDAREVASGGGQAAGEISPDRRTPALVEHVLRIEILAYVQDIGDMVFLDGWAGLLEQERWIEGFAVRPLEEIAANMIEYKTISANGIESAWTSDGAFCGGRGIGSPLVGFAMRLKPGADELYDCQYNGSFRSGAIVGPTGNGAFCRSTIADDPLDGIQLRIIARRALASPLASGVGTLSA
jgi:hypothetical protein